MNAKQTFRAFSAILERDSKDTTYKFALLRALVEVAEQDDQHRMTGNEHWVEFPMGLLVERWLYYYFPLLALDLPQRHGGTSIAFQEDFQAVLGCYADGRGLQEFSADLRRNEIPAQASERLWRLSANIRQTIARYPMKHLGFSHFADYYQVARPCARPRLRSLGRFSLDAMRDHLGTFEVRTDFYELFRDMAGFLIGKQAILFQWADFVSTANKRQKFEVETVLATLGAERQQQRDVALADGIYRKLLEDAPLECVWSGRQITKAQQLNVDHAIPFRWWGINDLWNLLPADKLVNAQKSDAIPAPSLIENRAPVILRYWELLRAANRQQFDLQIRDSLVGNVASDADWAPAGIRGLQRKAEYLITRRGCEAWGSAGTPDRQTASVFPLR